MTTKCACCFREPSHNAELPDWLGVKGVGGLVYFCPEHKGFLDSLKRVTDNRGRKTAIIYTYRGSIEKPQGGRYAWLDGYSATTIDGGVLYPWMSKRDCQKDALRFGRKAIFHRASQ